MKKLVGTFMAGASLLTLVACGSNGGTKIVNLDAPILKITDNVVSWDAVEHAKGYVVKVNDEEVGEQTATSYRLKKVGNYTISVKAVSEDIKKYYSSNFSESIEYSLSLNKTTVWVVGDSTVCDYAKYDDDGNKTGVTDKTYFYDRYGYATQLYNYFESDKITWKNLALSGRSSKSFLSESNYNTLKNEIKSGDYLIISWGHNDEKYDDADRYADASKPTTESGSLKYNLYNKYIKLAEDAGANPILTTPIVRLATDDNYDGSNGHKVTLKQEDIDKFGTTTLTGHSAGDVLDYRQAVIELGEEKNVPVVDLTTATKEKYTELGHEEAQYFHAMTAGNSATEPNLKSLDKTHINIYGAKMVSYMFTNLLMNTTSSLKKYAKDFVYDKITEPTKAKDLVVNEYYTYVEYTPIDLAAWSELVSTGIVNDDDTVTSLDHFKMTSDGWYGTAFGDTGGAPLKLKDGGYYACETSNGVFKVGQNKSGSIKGKISSTTEGYAFGFRQVSVTNNFRLSANGKVIENVNDGKQGGFGLMLRDDCYTPVNNSGIASNNICAGIYHEKAGSDVVIYSRESSALVKSTNTTATAPEVNSTVECSIERVGQVVTATVKYDGQTYTETYTDFDLVARDSEYMYIGMYGARGFVVEWTNVVFEITGDSQGA